jgi:hypothetical protein
MASQTSQISRGDRVEFIGNGNAYRRILGIVEDVRGPAINTTSGQPVIVWRELVLHADGGSHLGAECVHTADKLRLA